MKAPWPCGWIVSVVLLACAAEAPGQTLSQRGYGDVTGFLFPQAAAQDSTNLVGDALVREDVFYRPRPWLRLVAGLRFAANSHDQVAGGWRLDLADRGARRPRLSLSRASGLVNKGPVTVEVGKQVVRWGKTDIVTPTDRFAPRDYLNVLDAEILAVSAVRGVVQAGENTIEVVWAPRFTPSRTPLLEQRWAVVPPAATGIPITDAGAVLPSRSQVGVRWAHVGQAIEYSLAYFDGLSHAPSLQVDVDPAASSVSLTRVYPAIRVYGADAALPNRWFTVNAEVAYLTTSSPLTDETVLYVLQAERQSGEWSFIGGYAGEVVTRERSGLSFAPDRGLSRAFVGRASYTLDVNRSVAVEAAARQDGHGVYAKGEYSQARGQHVRIILGVVLIRGQGDDFLGQYRRNSHAALTLRYSF